MTDLPPLTALGRAVAHLMGEPAFARAPFEHIARSLVGQVTRDHYAIVCCGEDVAGVAGWALATEPLAVTWLRGERGFSGAEAADGDCDGDCIVLNFRQAEAPEVSQFIIAHEAQSHVTPIYAKRHYPDGRVRPPRLDLRSRAQKGGQRSILS